MNKKRPLTQPERRLILEGYKTGLSVDKIRRLLLSAGYRRGADTVTQCIVSTHNNQSISQLRQPLPCEYQCVFCDWLGPAEEYYAHWRTNHRTRAGHSKGELRRA